MPQRHRRGEVRLAAADLAHALHELHERAIAGEHEGVDHDAGLPAGGDLLQRPLDDGDVEPERILVDLAVRHRERARLAVRDHDDLAHVFLLRQQQAPGKLEALGRVGVIRPHLRTRQRGDRNFLGGIVKEHDLDGVAGKLRANEMREGERNFFRRRKAIFAVQNHRVRAIEHQHGRAARAVLGLTHHEIAVLEVHGHLDFPGANERVLQRLVDVDVQHVAKFVRLAPSIGLDACGQIGRVMAAEA